jgi:hypothetical protein
LTPLVLVLTRLVALALAALLVIRGWAWSAAPCSPCSSARCR